MTARYLLDTNIASYILKGHTAPRAHLTRVAADQLAVSVITEAELRYGIEKRPDAARYRINVEEFLVRMTILPWNSAAARAYAVLRAERENTGNPMGLFDLLIASHALAAGLILVTNDKTFPRIKKLKTQDWTK